MPVRWIALAVGAYLVFAIALVPADVAHRWFVPDDVRLSGVQGTVWSGSAALGSAGPLGFHDVQWQVRPWTVLLARPGGYLETDFGDGFFQADVRVGPGGVSLTGVRASCSLSALASALPIAGIRGQVSLQLAELVLRDGWPVSARGQLRLGQVTVPSLEGGDSIVLGNYNVTAVGCRRIAGHVRGPGRSVRGPGIGESHRCRRITKSGGSCGPARKQTLPWRAAWNCSLAIRTIPACVPSALPVRFDRSGSTRRLRLLRAPPKRVLSIYCSEPK